MNIKLFSAEELSILETLEIRGGSEQKQHAQYSCLSNIGHCPVYSGNCTVNCG